MRAAPLLGALAVLAGVALMPFAASADTQTSFGLASNGDVSNFQSLFSSFSTYDASKDCRVIWYFTDLYPATTSPSNQSFAPCNTFYTGGATFFNDTTNLTTLYTAQIGHSPDVDSPFNSWVSIDIEVWHTIFYVTMHYATVGGWTYDYAPPIGETQTRIVDTTPAGGSTAATSTTFTLGADTFINGADYAAGNLDWYLHIEYFSRNPTGSFDLLHPFGAVFPSGSFDFPLSVLDVGSASFSTTTPILTVGKYTVTTQIRRHTFWGSLLHTIGFGGFDQGIIVSTTTSFTVSTTTTADILRTKDITSILTGLTASSTSVANITECLTLNLGDCMAALFYPDQSAYDGWAQLELLFGTKPPFGYFSALGGLIGGVASSTPDNAGANVLRAGFAPLRAGISDILWLMVAIYIIIRLARWDWQS